MTTKKKSKKKKVKKKQDWSEILFSTSELTYYDLIVEEKNLNSIEKINEQISKTQTILKSFKTNTLSSTLAANAINKYL